MRAPPFYDSKAWRTARRQALHDAGWQCQRCHTSLVGKGRAAHVHHRKAYKVAPALGTEPLNLMPLCVSCHDAVHHEIKRSPGCDVRGRPIDADHPWFEPPMPGGA